MKFGVLLFAALAAANADTFTGPTSPLFLDTYTGDGFTMVEVQGTSIINTFPLGSTEEFFAIAGNTIYTRGNTPAVTNGAQYTLAGAPTGNPDAPALPPGETYSLEFDGTSNGTNNFFVEDVGVRNGVLARGVYQTSLDWSNPQLLFFVPSYGWRGISYDPNNQSLWISYPGFMADYSLDGSLITSFTTPGNLTFGLAYDAVDDTLWGDLSGTLFQYSTGGVLLQTGTISGMPSDTVFGLDSPTSDPPSNPSVPEPGTFSLLAGCVVGAVAVRRARIRRPGGPRH